ncbi:restriction endonuclease [Ectothiorhodospiraceae bacterium BW-2]|nr:restriction endonuclease [Ectothiorhodospiraceae bacterium BW-2]
MNESPAKYFKRYRESIGFTNQNDAKIFLSGKDVPAGVDYEYIDNLNQRLKEISSKVSAIGNKSINIKNIDDFVRKNILHPFETIKSSGLLPRLNNQGRRPEQVLFSWLRGYVVAELFTPAIAGIFEVSITSINQIGDDDLRDIDTFRRSPKADLEITKDNQRVRIEVQSGFQGINDIKEHKVREARRVFEETGEHSICIHIDLFNGQVAFVQLDSIEDDDVNFVTRQPMEGQSVFAIDQNYFKWRLLDPAPCFSDLELSI